MFYCVRLSGGVVLRVQVETTPMTHGDYTDAP